MTTDKLSSLKLILAFAAVYLIWGSTYLGIRFAIETIPPFLMAGVRFIVAGAILYLFSNRSKEKLGPAQYKSAAIIGLLMLLGGNGGVVWAEQFINSGLTALLISTVPIWVVIINLIFSLEKKNSLKNTIGVFLGFIGLFFLISPEHIISGGSLDLAGALVLIAASLSWSIGSVYTKHAVLPKSGPLSASLQMIAGGIGLMSASLIAGEFTSFDPAAISTRSLLAVIYLIIFGSLIAFSSYIWLLHNAGPSKATTYAYVNPIVAVILGWLLAGEELTSKSIIAAIIIISAVVIIITDFSKFKANLPRAGSKIKS